MKREKILKILPLILITLAFISFISYAFLTIDFEGTKISGVTKPNVSLSLDETKSIDLSLNKMNDTTGKAQPDTLEFTVSSKGKWDGKIPVNIYMKEVSKSIDNSNVKVYLTKVEGSNETQVLEPTQVSNLKPYKEDTDSYILNTGSFTFTSSEEKTYSETYRLRVWLKEDTVITDPGYTTKKESDGSISATTNDIKYSFKINVSTKKTETGAESIIAKVGTGGLVAESHSATEQMQATTAYRYTGANPDNYVLFNNELWRIIGVFDVDDGTGKFEKRIKLIRNESVGKNYWANANTDSWSSGSLMSLLNTGDYWNRAGAYSLTGLTEKSKQIIDNVKWYLGGTNSYTDSSNGLATHFYGYERSETVYSGKPTNWVGKVGLMYPSDYGYATGGGSTTNRQACLAKEMYKWNDSSVSDCMNNDWLYDASISTGQWTITPHSGGYNAFFLHDKGFVYSSGVSSTAFSFKPTVYLKSNIEIVDGLGTDSYPYIINSPEYDSSKNNDINILDKVGTGGLVAESHPATTQTLATTAYRYIGANPDNYVLFNNELWRIIGVFDVDDGTGDLEKRLKLIRNESVGQNLWANAYKDSWNSGLLMPLLNTGAYFNRTGTYSLTGLTEKSKTMISDAKWYLGGTANFTSVSNGLASHFYSYERSTTVYSGHPTSWIGKVGLMYPSDYGYATSGGSTTNREVCLAKELFYWRESEGMSDCYLNDWLYDGSIFTAQWTITPHSGGYNAFYVHNVGRVDSGGVKDMTLYFKPTVYLKSNIEIVGGLGTDSDPYQLELN